MNDVLRKLETAQLQRRGFTRTVINETVTTADERPVTSTVLHFYKKIPCRQLMFVEEEVRRLWPEAWGEDVSRRVVSAASRAMLFSGKMCTAGIEVHFPPRGGCAAEYRADPQHPRARGGCEGRIPGDRGILGGPGR